VLLAKSKVKRRNMDYITPEKMREADRRAQEEFGIPATILMENAGRAVFQSAMEMLSERQEKNVTVVCGRGNNGGDGFVAARHLMNNGIDVFILLVADVKELEGETKANYHRAEKIARAIASLLQKARASFGVLGNEENCDGNEANILGELSLFEMLVEDNIAQFDNLDIRNIVTLSPHSYNAIKNDYPSFKGNYNVLHYTQLFQELLREGKLYCTGTYDKKVTYHDPCFLGRWNSEYEAPREVIKSIPGVTLIEMERNRDSALCCGGGGGNFYLGLLGGSESSPSRRRVREAVETGADVLAVACPNCLTMLEDAVKAEGLEDSLVIKDIAELLVEICE